MKVPGNLPGPVHSDAIGQIAVATHYPGLLRPGTGRIKVYDLADAVHAGVGTPRTNRSHCFGGDAAKGGFQILLHGLDRQLGLGLPARKTAAVVADPQGHTGTRIPGLRVQFWKRVSQY